MIVSTPDHDRVRVCIHACQAGKDIYAEKPLTLYIGEGRTLVKAVRKYKRVLQVGTQQRSMEIDASYAAYDQHPIDERDEWGDLASFRAAAAAT